MKSKIKKASAIVLSLAVLVVISAAFAGPAADPVSGSGSTELNPETGTFVGTATLVIRGEKKEAKVEVTVLAPPEISEDGVQHVVATHTFTLDNGSITTSDKEIAEPTEEPGLYTLNATMTVVSGTGVYEGVSGHLTAHGTIDFRPELWAAEFEVNGAISAAE